MSNHRRGASNWFAACWPAGLAVRLDIFDIDTVRILARRLRNVYYRPCFKSDRSISPNGDKLMPASIYTHFSAHGAHGDTNQLKARCTDISPKRDNSSPKYNRFDIFC
ncbi:hypothetical protein PF010_g31826 [Phytophthora fragariae]|uniref:Uncharacterized protein n=1 Tax=Phytophthora fragariae TaxID=53985 RepID=A0A6A3GEZ7_9STRA|nr:hypothetical protein PF011_g31593 [Phytophthora fragariae]KAE9056269.1 hypothetical protein PF010_g31826 [Phytophthora fragariae]